MKKTVSEATESVANGDDDVSQCEDGARKKRGRPPKPEGSAKKPRTEVDPDAPKRKRGRPPKPGGAAAKGKKLPTLGADGEPRKGRGRPKKGDTEKGVAIANEKKAAAASHGGDDSDGGDCS